jgi:hypothetical protein
MEPFMTGVSRECQPHDHTASRCGRAEHCEDDCSPTLPAEGGGIERFPGPLMIAV